MRKDGFVLKYLLYLLRSFSEVLAEKYDIYINLIMIMKAFL